MDLSDLRTEVYARGFDYLNDATDTRVDRWINQSYRELCALMPWPFLEQTDTGAAPLTLGALRYVLSVTDTTNKVLLAPVDVRNLQRIDPTLDDTGAPCAWYLENTVMKVWPVSTPSLSVRYILVPPLLSADSDDPLVPEEWQDIIVDGAVCRAQKDNDDYGPMQATRQEWQRQVDAMVVSLMNRALDRPQFIFQSEPKDY